MFIAVRVGSKGQIVQEIQFLLNQMLGPKEKLSADGVFGHRTAKAVQWFQSRHGLKPDGIVGPATWAKLHGRSGTQHALPGHDAFDPLALAKWLALPFSARDLHGGRPATTSPKPVFGVSGNLNAPKTQDPKTAKPGPSILPHKTENLNHTRGSYPGFTGRSWILKDFRKYDGWAIQLIPSKTIQKHDPSDPIKNQCAQFVQLFGVPKASTWRAGPLVCGMKPGEIPTGTVVATLRDGIYHNDMSGRSHVGIYLRHDAYQGSTSKGGITIFDQYNGAPIQERTKLYSADAEKEGKFTKKWIDQAGNSRTNRVNWVSDGEEYFVLLT